MGTKNCVRTAVREMKKFHAESVSKNHHDLSPQDYARICDEFLRIHYEKIIEIISKK